MTDTATAPAPDTATTQTLDWRQHIPEDVKGDATLAPILEKMSEKDVPSLIKSHAHLQRKLGAAITLPGKDAKPEEVAALRTRLAEAGVIPAAPASPKDYDIKRPESMPEGVAWNDELAGEFATVLHKHGISKDAVGDLLALQAKALGGGAAVFKGSKEEGEAALKSEFGDKYADVQEDVKRFLPSIFKTPEEVAAFEASGLANDPRILGPIMRLSQLAKADSSFLPDVNRTESTPAGEEVRAELARIMNDKTHPMHEGWRRRDPKVEAHIDELYKKAYGTGQVALGSEGITVGPRPA